MRMLLLRSVEGLAAIGDLVETKVSKTRRIDFTCSVIMTCNETKRLRKPLLSRFAVIEFKVYESLEEFKGEGDVRCSERQ